MSHNEKTVDNLIIDLANTIKSGETAIFCGAGISYNSGFPMACQIKKEIFKSLLDNNDEIALLMRAFIPLEVLVGTIANHVDVYGLLKIFEGGMPNTTTRFIAKLAKGNYLNTIVTTNFDTLIETAIKDEKKDYDLFYNEEQFSSVDFKSMNKNKTSLFKIHGSVGDDSYESIRIVMKQVSDQKLSEKRRGVVEHLFSTGDFGQVLLIGYSCSDTDIIRHIEDLASTKEVLFIQHSGDVEKIEHVNTIPPFKKYNGMRVFYNTDKLVRKLWNSDILSLNEEYQFIRHKLDWTGNMYKWCKEVNARDNGAFKQFVIGLFFMGAAEVDKAILHFLKSSKTYESIPGTEKLLAENYLFLGTSYGLKSVNDTCHASNSVSYFEKALQTFSDLGDKAGMNACYIHLSSLYRNIGNSEKSLEYHLMRQNLIKNNI